MRTSGTTLKVGCGEVPIVPFDESAMYLGRRLTFSDFHDTEIDHRITRGWAKFHKHKLELCGKHFPLKDRLRLFEAVITPTVLYSAGTWTMNAERERKLKTAQRRMLRTIVKVGRRPIPKNENDDVETTDSEQTQANSSDASAEPQVMESYVEWITRATRISEKAAAGANVTDWIRGQRHRKWSLCGHTLRREDGRWSTTVLKWNPGGSRKIGHPVMRWTDELDKFSLRNGFCWREKAFQRKAWIFWGRKFQVV